jgi:hypothetical protein
LPARGTSGTLALPADRVQVKRQVGASRRRRRHTRSGRVTGAVVLSLLVVGSLVALTLFHRGPAKQPAKPSPGGTSSPPPSLPPANTYRPVQVLSVREMAENGNRPIDNLGELHNVIGDNPSAFWQSDKYNSANFGGYGGLGLVLQLGATHLLHELVVTTPMKGWSAETFVSSSGPRTLSGWGKPIERLSGISGNALFSLGDKTGKWVLFWMLDPGPTEKAVVDKVSVR